MWAVSKTLKILHISDLHFGKINSDIVKKLTDFILKSQGEGLDLIVLTGDLTQRARRQQFAEAQRFLKAFSTPIVAVPGNHDIPLFNIFSRLFTPLRNYKRYISPHIKEIFEKDDIVVCGINTPNRYTVKDGHLHPKEIKKLHHVFRDKNKVKIIACHHSLHIESLQRKFKDIIDVTQPHIIMYGHDHQSGVYFLEDQQSFPLLVAAGTGTSSRTRKEANSFNLMTIDSCKITVDTYVFDQDSFRSNENKVFSIDSLIQKR
jgi:3',5'-cyclic AMP phosphodiesterase CpdA